MVDRRNVKHANGKLEETRFSWLPVPLSLYVSLPRSPASYSNTLSTGTITTLSGFTLIL